MAETLAFLREGLVLAVWLTWLPLATAVVVGVLVSLVQTMLSVQDQSLPFAFKLLAVGLVLALCGRWMGSELLALGNKALLAIATVRVAPR